MKRIFTYRLTPLGFSGTLSNNTNGALVEKAASSDLLHIARMFEELSLGPLNAFLPATKFCIFFRHSVPADQAASAYPDEFITDQLKAYKTNPKKHTDKAIGGTYAYMRTDLSNGLKGFRTLESDHRIKTLSVVCQNNLLARGVMYFIKLLGRPRSPFAKVPIIQTAITIPEVKSQHLDESAFVSPFAKQAREAELDQLVRSLAEMGYVISKKDK